MSKYIPLSDKLKVVRKKIKKGCPGLSIRMGRGTGYGWFHIRNTKDYKLTEAQEQHIISLGLTTGLNNNIAKTIFSPDELEALYLNRDLW